jgi:hypothetical protein
MMEKLIRLITGTKDDEPRPDDAEFDRQKEEARKRQEDIDRRLDVIETYARQATGVRKPFKRRRTDQEEEPRT